jgi:hypothetical protein
LKKKKKKKKKVPLFQEGFSADHVLSNGGGFPGKIRSRGINLVEQWAVIIISSNEQGDSKRPDSSEKNTQQIKYYSSHTKKRKQAYVHESAYPDCVYSCITAAISRTSWEAGGYSP